MDTVNDKAAKLKIPVDIVRKLDGLTPQERKFAKIIVDFNFANAEELTSRFGKNFKRVANTLIKKGVLEYDADDKQWEFTAKFYAYDLRDYFKLPVVEKS